MSQTIKSAILAIACLAAAAGGTAAYFSDAETAGGNVFNAGKIDLKVDAEARYNGLACIDGAWADPEPPACPAGPEKGAAPKCGETGADRECREYGFDYALAKWEWNNCAGRYVPEGDPGGTAVTGDERLAAWRASTTVDGVIRKAGRFYDVFPGGTSGTVAAAKHDISHLTFCRHDRPVCGDCVREEGEECDGPDGVPAGFVCSPACRLVFRSPCAASWAETDLGSEARRFFDLAALRPGDEGESTLSLRVYGNDAWGRLEINDIDDSDGGCVEPEAGVDPDCAAAGDPGGAGELGAALVFESWLDMGSVPGFQNTGLSAGDPGFDNEEGDNIKQAGEPDIFGPAGLNPAGETWLLAPALKAAYFEYCAGYPADGQGAGGACHGLAADGRLAAETVYYLGVEWRLPRELPGPAWNALQSDVFTADLELIAEQFRHNPAGAGG